MFTSQCRTVQYILNRVQVTTGWAWGPWESNRTCGNVMEVEAAGFAWDGNSSHWDEKAIIWDSHGNVAVF